jgi:hypothetical protein
MSVSRCCHLRCRRPATVVHEIGHPRMVRRYEVCDDHDADYFGGGSLSVKQLQRIMVDMAPTQVRDDTTRSMPAR